MTPVTLPTLKHQAQAHQNDQHQKIAALRSPFATQLGTYEPQTTQMGSHSTTHTNLNSKEAITPSVMQKKLREYRNDTYRRDYSMPAHS